MTDPNDEQEESAGDIAHAPVYTAEELLDMDLRYLFMLTTVTRAADGSFTFYATDDVGRTTWGVPAERALAIIEAKWGPSPELVKARAIVAGFNDSAAHWGDMLGAAQRENAELKKRLAALEAR